jgi:hypothetical protein
MPSGAEQLLSHRSGYGRGSRCRHREVVMGCRAPQTLHPEPGLDRPAGVAVVVAVQDVRTPATPLVARSAVEVRPIVGRTSGVHATGVQATGAIRVSGRTRVRCRRPLHRPSAPCWILEWVGAAGHPRCAAGWRVSLWSASGVVVAAESGLAGEGWSYGWQCGGSQEGRRPTWASTSHAQRPRRRVCRLADQGSRSSARCRSVGWEYEREQVLPGLPHGVLGRLPACCPTMGLEREVVTTLGGR